MDVLAVPFNFDGRLTVIAELIEWVFGGMSRDREFFSAAWAVRSSTRDHAFLMEDPERDGRSSQNECGYQDEMNEW